MKILCVRGRKVKTWILKMAYWLRRVRDRFTGKSVESMASKDRCDSDDLTVEEMTIGGRTLLIVRFCVVRFPGEKGQMEALKHWCKLNRENRGE